MGPSGMQGVMNFEGFFGSSGRKLGIMTMACTPPLPSFFLGSRQVLLIWSCEVCPLFWHECVSKVPISVGMALCSQPRVVQPTSCCFKLNSVHLVSPWPTVMDPTSPFAKQGFDTHRRGSHSRVSCAFRSVVPAGSCFNASTV